MKLFSKVGTFVTNKMGRTGLKIAKYAPDAMVFIGGGMVIGGFILGCRNTYYHCDEIIRDHNDKMDDIAEAVKQAEADPEQYEYTDKQRKADTFHCKMDTTWRFVKLYALPAAMTLTGTGLMAGGAFKFKSLFNGAAAAFAAQSEELGFIKSQIYSRLGEEEGERLIRGVTRRNIEMTKTGDDGEELVVNEQAEVLDAPRTTSLYTIIFDESCKGYRPNTSYNLTFLQQLQQQFTDMLRSRGHVFLNEVYDAIGKPRTKEGAVVGWCKGYGDDYVDFGIYNVMVPSNRALVNGDESYFARCLLNFNVAGLIWDKI